MEPLPRQSQHEHQQQPHQQQPYQTQTYQTQPHQEQPVAASTQTIMSVVDVRRQIIANALRRRPDIVKAHATKFPSIPVRAEDIFDVTIHPDIELLADGSSARTYLARLTHADSTDLATRVFVLGGRSQRTVEGALHSLLVLSSE